MVMYLSETGLIAQPWIIPPKPVTPVVSTEDLMMAPPSEMLSKPNILPILLLIGAIIVLLILLKV